MTFNEERIIDIKSHRKQGSDLFDELGDYFAHDYKPNDHKANNLALWDIWQIINSENCSIKGYSQRDIWCAALNIVYKYGLDLAYE